MYAYTVHCSVKEMVEFVFRSGSIDYRYKSGKRAKKGIQIHQILQERHSRQALSAGLEYESEFTLSADIEYKDIHFDIEGRADGIVRTKDCIHIEEIKSTQRELEEIEKPSKVHLAQAKCYGYLYCLLYKPDKAVIYLTYCSTESLKVKVFSQQMSFNELKRFFYDVIEKYYFWCELSMKMTEERNSSIKGFDFPFGSFRKGQRELSAAVYKTIRSGRKLFAQAPTGTGKTVSTLFPAIKILPEIKASPGKIFYLTAKNITRTVAEGSVRKMTQKGLKIKAVILSAKEKTCINDGGALCSSESCPYANGHFDRVNTALLDIITEKDVIALADIIQTAKKYTVCPFELGLDISLFSDIIICDYNYAYDPKAKLKRFFADKTGDYIALVDEAHNLADRARDMYSAALMKSDFTEAIKIIGEGTRHINRTLSKINAYFVRRLSQLDSEKEAQVWDSAPDEFTAIINDFLYDADFWLSEKGKGEDFDKVLELYFKAQDFVRIAELYDDRFKTVLERKEGTAAMKLMCLDPSYLLSVEEKNFISSVFFSATLTPIDYFIEILGGDKNENHMAISSPFDPKRLFVAADTGISTLYKNREESYEPVADRLFEMVSAREGNYFAFFSSYHYMDEVSRLFESKYPEINTLKQARAMSEAQKESFINQFKNSYDMKLGFVVLGGAFSEGIDLTGDSLIGAAVIGVGLPMLCLEKDMIAQYYSSKGRRGFEYAYQYPGINKVLQAAGRVIRTENDKGVVLLIDCRYGDNSYRRLLPPQWSVDDFSGENRLSDLLKAFWKE